MTRWLCGVMFAIATLGLSGCGGGAGDGPKLHAISGVATHQGKPLAKLAIYFAPSSANTYSQGTTNDQGQFSLSYTAKQSGAVAGENTVYVQYVPQGPEEESLMAKPDFVLPSPHKEVLAKYGKKESSPLKVTVDGPKSNLELKLD